MKKAIFLFNYTDIMVRDWLDAGYQCWSFDGKHPDGVTREGNHVKVGMWFEAEKAANHADRIARLVGEGVEIVVSFAECTYLTTTGARWFYHPDDKHLPYAQRRPHPSYPNRRKDQADAVVLAKMVQMVSEALAARYLPKGGVIPWMLENPAVSSLNTLWRKPDHKFDPCQYGGYLPEDDAHPLFPDIYPPRDAYRKNTGIWCGGGFQMPRTMSVDAPAGFPGFEKLGGKSDRTKEIRSCTPRGFARAVFIDNAKF